MFSNKELRSIIVTLFFEQLLVMLVGIVDTFVVSSCGGSSSFRSIPCQSI